MSYFFSPLFCVFKSPYLLFSYILKPSSYSCAFFLRRFNCNILLFADFSCSCQCTVPLHKAAVWTLLLSPNCHLPGSLLWSGLRLVVPRKVRRSILSLRSTSDVSCFHLCRPLVFTQVISPSWFPPLSWRAACRCGWAHWASTASETPSVPTQSWSSALKDWERRLSCWRQGEFWISCLWWGLWARHTMSPQIYWRSRLLGTAALMTDSKLRLT